MFEKGTIVQKLRKTVGSFVNLLKPSVYVLNKPTIKQSQTPSKRKKWEARKNKKEIIMYFWAELLFKIESTAEFNMSYRNTYFKDFYEFTMINFLCSFRANFHQHPFIFEKDILLITNDFMVPNYKRLLRITYTENRKSYENVLNILFLKWIVFRGYTI